MASEYGPYEDETEALEEYRGYLDEVYGDVQVAEYTYATSRVLEELDPIAFREGFNDWVDTLETEEEEKWGTPYTNPEGFDLTYVGAVEWNGNRYEFNLTAVWVDEEGTYFWASDSGCSCPSPFEWLTGLDHEGVSSGTKIEVIAALSAHEKAGRALDLIQRLLTN